MTRPDKSPRALIHWGAEQFDRAGLAYGHGTDNALDEAAALVLHVLEIGYEQPDAVLDTVLGEADYARVMTLLETRISSRKPAAYLVDEAWFAGLPFYVDARVLVPRSPLAELILAKFSPWIDAARVNRVLDIGTGSGCIAVACASVFPQAHIDATDISADALQVAHSNVQRHDLQARVTLLESDLFSGLGEQRYDIIVSNPPYVPREEVAQLAEEYRHEPAGGLVAGEDGLDIVVRMLKDAGQYLQKDGILVVEVGHTQTALQAQYQDVPFLWLDFEHGGSGVFLLEATQLAHYQAIFNRVAQQRNKKTEEGV